MNTDAPWPTPAEAEARVLGIQTKLHQWATDDSSRRFRDLANLVYDPAFLLVGWRRVRGNRGARSAGVDGRTARSVAAQGEEQFLSELRADLKARTFQPLPVRERLIPKSGSTKLRRLGIATVRDRVVQAALKLVLEPIFEADFQPCSYGFRPNRRAHDAIAEIQYFCTRSYEWILEADIEACFDEIDHTALMGRVRHRIGDRRVLGLVMAFLKAGVLSQEGVRVKTDTGAPQGGILSPLLANIALSVLDDHVARTWEAVSTTYVDRARRRRQGLSNHRLVRYADDFVVLVSGTQAHAEALKDEVAEVLRPMGLRLSVPKTRICHIDEGFVFLGHCIRRDRKRGSAKQYVYTYPSRAALLAVKSKVRALSREARNQTLTSLLDRLNPVLRGWTAYFRYAVPAATFNYLRAFAWRRVVCWLRHKHLRTTWKQLRRRYLPGWWPTEGETAMFNPAGVTPMRYRYRGAQIPSPWTGLTTGAAVA
ncbi:MAG: group II intron reverse transcriptase/maturase [Acidimicrobiales bacterium]